ncbi:MAG: CaiB/BaiF CoA-transferase family protein, partial [Chloroflexota bacterium]
LMTGMFGATAALVALRERDSTGKGQLVKSTLFETAAFTMGQHMAYGAVSGTEVPPMPARVSAWGIYHQFEVLDGERVFVGVTSDKQWLRFCELFERPDLLEDERIGTNNGRVAEQDWLLPNLRQMLSQMSKADVIRRCEQANLPFSPIARPEDLFDDPQLNEGLGLLETQLPNGNMSKLPRLPFTLQNHDFDLQSQPPQVGEHTADLLQELGYSSTKIKQLNQNHIITINKHNE